MPIMSIPTKPYLRKYAQYVTGRPMLRETGDSHIEIVLNGLLRGKFFPQQVAVEKRYTDTIQRFSPLKLWSGFNVTTEIIVFYNDYVFAHFAQDLHKFCVDYMKLYQFGGELLEQVTREYEIYVKARDRRNFLRVARLDQAIEQFSATIGISIEEDISMDNLKKIQQRERHRQSKIAMLSPTPVFENAQLTIDFK